jgi:hypothetical protein
MTASDVVANVFDFPTTSASTEGAITQNKSVLLHTFGNYNFFAGENSGNFTLDIGQAIANIGIGSGTLSALTSGDSNISIGLNAGRSIQTGIGNVIIGTNAGRDSILNVGNVYVGSSAGKVATSNNNTILGDTAGIALTNGANNTFVGKSAGLAVVSGSGNLHLGYLAGSQETGSNTLYIDNSNTTTPLIHGDFNTDVVTIYENLRLIDNDRLLFGSGLTENTSFYFDGDDQWIDLAGSTSATASTATDLVIRLQDNGGTSRLLVFDTDSEPVMNLDSNGNLITGNNFQVGDGEAGVDYTITMDGEDADGVLTWEEDEDQFSFADDVVVETTFTVNGTGVVLSSIPVSDPETDGNLWNSEGDVRIAEDFSPDDIGGLVGWLKSDTEVFEEDSFTTPSTDGNDVGGWKDQAGQNFHFTQANAANKPVYNANELNGFASIDFDGSDDVLVNDSSELSDAAFDGDDPDYTVFFVHQFDDLTFGDQSYTIGADSGEDGDARVKLWQLQAASAGWSYERNDDANTGLGLVQGITGGDSLFHIFVARTNGTLIQEWVGFDTDMSATYDVGQVTLSRVGIAAHPHPSGFFNHAGISAVEMIVYDSTLSTYNMNRVGNYLEAKYDLPWEDIEVDPVYGSFYTNTNQTVTISAGSTPTEIPGGMTIGTTTVDIMFISAHALRTIVAGNYLINWEMSTSFAGAPGGAREAEGGIMVNGSAINDCQTHRTMSNSTDTGALGGTCIFPLAVNDEVSGFVENLTNADDIDVEHYNLTIFRLGDQR